MPIVWMRKLTLSKITLVGLTELGLNPSMSTTKAYAPKHLELYTMSGK